MNNQLHDKEDERSSKEQRQKQKNVKNTQKDNLI